MAQVLLGWPGEERVLRPALDPGDGPFPGHDYDADGVVVLGSRASVHDGLDWMRALAAWLDPVLRGDPELPVLGICFGHQLIAHMAGGEVGFVHPDGAKEVGIEETLFDGSRLVPGRRSLRVVASHREEVKVAPRGYRVVARRGSIAVDGMEHERLPIFSFQFHPEARGEFLAHAGADPACLDLRVVEEGGILLGAFRRLVLDRAGWSA